MRIADSQKGFVEKNQTFTDLDELFRFCSSAEDELIDRLVIENQDRKITFTFNSIML
jgi:hypothetical protein